METSSYIIKSSATIREALVRINEHSSDILTLFVVDDSDVVLGSLTDGDIRRGLISGKTLEDPIIGILPGKFYHFTANNITIELIREIRTKKIKLVPLLDDEGKITRLYDFTRKYSILPVDAVLMAGGRGERLRPLTDKTPKPLLKVGNKPVIEHNIDKLAYYGIENIRISVNYLKDQIIEHFKNQNRDDINIMFIEESSPLGTIGSLSLVEEFDNDTVLVMNSDLYTNINYEEFYLHFKKEKADLAIASIPYNVNVPYAILGQAENQISELREKPTYTFYANAGIYLMKKELIKHIPVNKPFNATDLIQALLDHSFKIVKYPIIGYWFDIGRYDDYQKVQQLEDYINN